MMRKKPSEPGECPVSPERPAPAEGSFLPSSRLLRAAMSGLLAAGAAACGDDSGEDESSQELSEEELTALCQDKVDEAVDEAREEQDLEALCADMVQAATDDFEPSASDLDTWCGDRVQASEEQCTETMTALEEQCAPLLATAEEKTINSAQEEHLYADLTEDCDELGGYTQVGAACGGHNACAGFSYADWGPGGATLTEHSCAGTNACNGLYCKVLPEDEGRTGAEIYELEYADPGPNACVACHAVYPEGEEDPDVSKFKVWVFEGEARHTALMADLTAWPDRSVAEQERMIAFGVHGVLENGTAYNAMAPYHQVLSRAEIERVVEHLRGLDPVLEVYKTADP